MTNSAVLLHGLGPGESQSSTEAFCGYKESLGKTRCWAHRPQLWSHNGPLNNTLLCASVLCFYMFLQFFTHTLGSSGICWSLKRIYSKLSKWWWSNDVPAFLIMNSSLPTGIEIELETAENDPNGWRLLIPLLFWEARPTISTFPTLKFLVSVLALPGWRIQCL